MRSCAPALFVFALPVAAQQSNAAPAMRLLLSQDVVSSATLQPIAKLGLTGYVREAVWLGEQTYALDDVTVDLAAMEVLEMGERIRLRSVDQQEKWSVDRAASGVQGANRWRLLLGARIVLPRAGGGLVALERKTGAVAWQQADTPSEVVIAEGDLVIAAGMVRDQPWVDAFALPNGARGCRFALDGPPQRLVACVHGIAVGLGTGVTVRDRSGPALFAKDAPVRDLVAGPDGWFARTGSALQRWDRRGEVIWTRLDPIDRFEWVSLAVTTGGALLVLRYCPISDSGATVTCHDAIDGKVLWHHAEPGLGVAHSKYRHRVHARVTGDAVFVVSQASGGNFVVELDASTGDQRRREEFARQ